MHKSPTQGGNMQCLPTQSKTPQDTCYPGDLAETGMVLSTYAESICDV